jgi:hypothetical protein
LYGDYEKGRLWESGGVADQPSLYLEAMHVIAQELHAIQEAKLAENERRSQVRGSPVNDEALRALRS